MNQVKRYVVNELFATKIFLCQSTFFPWYYIKRKEKVVEHIFYPLDVHLSEISVISYICFFFFFFCSSEIIHINSILCVCHCHYILFMCINGIFVYCFIASSILWSLFTTFVCDILQKINVNLKICKVFNQGQSYFLWLFLSFCINLQIFVSNHLLQKFL